MEPTNATGQHVHFEDDGLLRARALERFRPSCRYLRYASVTGSGAAEPALLARGDFSLPSSCFVEKRTRHVSAVEVTLCSTQLLDYAFAEVVRQRLFAPFDRWTPEQFWAMHAEERMFLLDVHVNFRHPLDPLTLRGELELVHITGREGRSGPLLLLDLAVRFGDARSGRCTGGVKTAVINPPAGRAPDRAPTQQPG